MLIATLVESMLGNDSEFTQVTVLLPLEVDARVRDLANKLGVPANRLLSELVRGSIAEAESEWRGLTLDRAQAKPAPPEALSFSLHSRVKG